MYILRHPGDAGALFIIGRGPGVMASSGKLETLGTPGTENTRLANANDCIIVHVYDGDVELLITVCQPEATFKAPRLRLDKIALGVAANQTNSGKSSPTLPSLADFAGKSYRSQHISHQQPQHTGSAPPQYFGAENALGSVLRHVENISSTLAATEPFSVSASGITLIGHIESLGDKLAMPGEILSGEAGKDLRLEGFQLNWPDIPDGLQLTYSVRLEGVQNELKANLGEFCGTRGQARRIVALSFNLTGLHAHQYQIKGYANFSGGFRVPLGFGVKLGGPSGFEHLTGLQIDIK